MASTPNSSLEEIFWRSPPHVQMMGGYLHSNNILFYFAESPFFDATSNNASLAIQANYNEAFRHFVETREAFEGRLKTMQGLEFMVAFDPLQTAAARQSGETGFAHEPSNIWVIRKQNRRKHAGMDDEVQVLSTYFVVGDCIYMAPSVVSVVENRILSAVTSLTRLLKTASSLPIFTPSYGHTYLPPAPRIADTSQAQGALQSQPSKENTPMPDADSQVKGAPLLASQSSSVGSAYQDTRTLAEAFSLLAKYGDEYMDENPLVGEPGSFILSKSSEASGTAPAAKSGFNLAAPTPTAMSRSTTPSVRMDASVESVRTSEKGGGPVVPEESKAKRKKSKAGS